MTALDESMQRHPAGKALADVVARILAYADELESRAEDADQEAQRQDSLADRYFADDWSEAHHLARASESRTVRDERNAIVRRLRQIGGVA